MSNEVTVITGEDNIRMLSLRVLIRTLETEIVTGMKFSNRASTHHAALRLGVDEPRSKKKRLWALKKILTEMEATQ